MKFSDTTVVRVGSQPGACQTGGEEEWHWDRFCYSTADFTCQYHSTSAAHSVHLNTTLIRRTSGRSL